MDNLTTHVRRKTTGEYEFSATASEITILDRLGRIIWRQRRTSDAAPIRWPGIDLYGIHVDVGSYMCKIVYPHNAQAVYLPFVFVRS